MTYQYDPAGNLAAYANTLGEQTAYEYDIDGRMVKYFAPEYPAQPLVVNVYDELDRIKQQTNALGRDFY